jgi:hypothetical protein
VFVATPGLRVGGFRFPRPVSLGQRLRGTPTPRTLERSFAEVFGREGSAPREPGALPPPETRRRDEGVAGIAAAIVCVKTA